MFISLIISTVIFVAAITVAIVVSKLKYKSKRIITPINTMFTGTFMSSAVLFFSIYFNEFSSNPLWTRVSKSLILCVHHSIRLFAIDCDFDIITASISESSYDLQTYFSFFASILFITAPILTFGFILTFFKNIMSYKNYLYKFFKDVYVFSELNERSLSLAQSIARNKKNAIVFTDVFSTDDEESYDLVEGAKEIGAICFKKDMLSVNFKLHSKKKNITFFCIGFNEAENIKHAFDVIENFSERDNTMVYLFSSDVDGELIMMGANNGKVKVRRINDNRSLVYRTLYDMEEAVINYNSLSEKEKSSVDKKPEDLFTTAAQNADGTKHISAIVIGCGGQGTEMIKILSWFCQMDGYKVSINAFDRDPNAESKFAAICPELMDDRYNGKYIEGESYYLIDFHSGIDALTLEFQNQIQSIKDATYVFVSLGSDEMNIRIALLIRSLLARRKVYPIIHSVVYNTDKKSVLTGIKNARGQNYDIQFVGDLKSIYSEEVILDSELEQDALQRHLKWGAEDDFWAFEYNYRSSMASALHMKARVACGILGADKHEDDLTEEERDVIEKLEHKRWNAYMRSEGFVYSGSKDKSSRNDLAKMHHDLVPFDDLTEEEKRKDSRVGTK